MSENKRRLSVKKWVNRNQFFVFGVSFLLFLGLAVGTKVLHSNVVKSRKTTINVAYAKVVNAYSELPSPEEMKPGIVNSETSQVVRNSVSQTEVVRQVMSQTNCKFDSYFLIPKHCFDISNDTAYLEKSFSEYTSVLSSLQNFIEYNPKIDTENYSPGATQTTERMNKLREGLDSSKKELERFNVSTAKDDLIKIIESAQESQARLEQTGETEPFVILYEQLQKEVIKQLVILFNEAGIKIQQGSQNILKSI